MIPKKNGGKVSIKVRLGSEVADGSYVLIDYSKAYRAAILDQAADLVAEELKAAFPGAEVEVTCKPGIEALKGEPTDTIITSEWREGDMTAEAIEAVVKDYVDSIVTDLLDDSDAIAELASELAEEVSNEWDEAS